MLNLYLDLEKLRFNDKVKVHLNISPKIETAENDILLPPLLIQPIIENAFKHGLFHKQGIGNLWIDFDWIENQYLKCTIKDDGIGREAAKNINTWRKKHISSGMAATEQRLKFRHRANDKNLENYFNIEDCFDNDSKPSGTKITLVI